MAKTVRACNVKKVAEEIFGQKLSLLEKRIALLEKRGVALEEDVKTLKSGKEVKVEVL